MIRGAASLQFGPQFGGLINFKLKEANPNKKIELVLRNSLGSFGLNNTFLSLGSTYKKNINFMVISIIKLETIGDRILHLK